MKNILKVICKNNERRETVLWCIHTVIIMVTGCIFTQYSLSLEAKFLLGLFSIAFAASMIWLTRLFSKKKRKIRNQIIVAGIIVFVLFCFKLPYSMLDMSIYGLMLEFCYIIVSSLFKIVEGLLDFIDERKKKKND